MAIKTLNKATPLIILPLFFASPLFAAEAYKCTSQTGEVTLQDTACNNQQTQEVYPLFEYSQTATSGLRPYELIALERLHEHTMMSQYIHLDTRAQAKLNDQQFRQDVEFEKLRHQHAIEMFDKSYHHFFTYGVANGPGSFPIGYHVGGFNQDFTDFNANSNNQNQGFTNGDVINLAPVGNIQ